MLTIGQVVGHYEVLEKLGEGGMGVVYKARDKHLDRVVALKLLSADKVGDDNRLRRFTLEARAASSLNHPHIVTVHDISSENGNQFIVMEYVLGKTLDQLIPRKGMRLNEALKTAIQIAEALGAAAAAGIVHRDLKPGNVMVTDSGAVKVLDFGLAKLTEASGSEGSLTTIADPDERPRTHEGTVLGTFSYMSPEQAEGKPLDPRSDIFSFGALLYEMVTGQRAFRGDTGMSTISSILRDEPKPASQISVDLPRDLEKIISRCLRKDRERRFQTIADVRIALLELKEESDSGKLVAGETPQNRKRQYRWMLGGLVAVLVLAAAGIGLYVHSREPQPEMRLVPFTSYTGFQGFPAFSPDGNQIAFAWTGEQGSVTHIYAKVIGTDSPLQLTHGDQDDISPAWAPDGKSVAFLRVVSGSFAGIYQVSPLGGSEHHVAEIGAPEIGALVERRFPHLSWSSNGKWLVTAGREALNKPSRILVISVDDGDVRTLSPGTTGDEVGPALSPDSRMMAFSRRLSEGDAGLFVVDLDESLRLRGVPRQLNTPSGASVGPAWTADGKELVFWHGIAGPVSSQLWRVSASGATAARPIAFVGNGASYPAIAAHGNRLAFSHSFNDINVWRMSITAPGRAGEPVPMITSTRGDIVRPHAFSPDGRRIAFESDRSGALGVWLANADGRDVSLLFGGPTYLSGSPAWSPDGQWIAFDTRKDKNAQIYVVSADGGAPRRLSSDPFDHLVPYWSSDGKWLYFQSNHTGRMEIYRIPSKGGAAVQITRNGGWAPQESSDGKFLYYTRDRNSSTPLMRMPVGGGREEQILASVFDRTWAVVNQGIWFVDGVGIDNSSLRFFDFKTDKAVTVAKLPKVAATGLAISPNGRDLLYNQIDNRGTEILLVENFR